jgi:hypothetical protein
MKAISPILSHTILLAVGLAAITLILISVSNFSADMEKISVTSQLSYAAEFVKGEILRIYSLANQSNTTNKVKLSLPERIGNEPYTIELYQNGLKVETSLRNEVLEINKKVNISAILNGTSSLPASIMQQKLENGDILISLVG